MTFRIWLRTLPTQIDLSKLEPKAKIPLALFSHSLVFHTGEGKCPYFGLRGLFAFKMNSRKSGDQRSAAGGAAAGGAAETVLAGGDGTARKGWRIEEQDVPG